MDGKAVRKDVTIIGEAGITAAVVGLAAGDVVIVSPPPGLIQGSQVQIVAQQQAGAASARPERGPGRSAKAGSAGIGSG